MCGLFGWIRNGTEKCPNDTLLRLTRHLAISMQGRGSDSTGLAVGIPATDPPIIYKSLQPAQHAWHGWEPALAPQLARARWVIGHTRSATVGGATLENAHPFLMGKTVGAHNGHLLNHAALAVDRARYQLPACDSAALIAYLDQVGPQKAIGDAWGSLRVVYSTYPWETVSLFSDQGGQLAMVYIKKWALLVWCSEEELLQVLLRCEGLDFREGKKGLHGYVVEFPINTLRTVPYRSLGGRFLLSTDVRLASAYVPQTYVSDGWASSIPRTPAKHWAWGTKGGWHSGAREACSRCTQSGEEWLVHKRKGGEPVRVGGPGKGEGLRECLNCHMRSLEYLLPAPQGWRCGLCGAWQHRGTESQSPKQLPILTGGNGYADSTTE